MTDVALVELEGVIFETREVRRASLCDALDAQSLDAVFDPDDVLGLPTRAAVVVALAGADLHVDDTLIDLLAASADRAFTSKVALGAVTLQPGAREFLERAGGSVRLGVVTRARRTDVDTLLRLAGLEHVFATIVSADDVLDPKPSAEGHLLAIERLARLRPVNRGSVLSLEDAASGIAAARACGLPCVAVGRVPAHIAMEADAYVGALEGQTLSALVQLARPGEERVQ